MGLDERFLEHSTINSQVSENFGLVLRCTPPDLCTMLVLYGSRTLNFHNKYTIEPTSSDPLYSEMMAQGDCTEIDHLHDDDDDVSFSETIRRKAMSFIERNKIFSKDKVHMQDAVGLVLILFQLDRLHLHSNPEDFQDNCFFGVEKITKKVNQLVLQKSSTSYFPLESISSLGALEDLKLYNINIRSPITPNTDQYDGLQIHRQTLHNVKNLDVSFLVKEGEETVLETRCFHLLPKLESVMFRIFTSRTEKLYFRDVLLKHIF